MGKGLVEIEGDSVRSLVDDIDGTADGNNDDGK